MNILRTTAAALAALALVSSCSTPQLRLKPGNIDKIIAALTLEEKVHLVMGTNLKGFSDSAEVAVAGYTGKLVKGSAGTTYPVERLGIPAIVMADGPAGLRINPLRDGDSLTYYCTAYPIGLSLASSWDNELIAKVGAAMGHECREYGVDVLLGPGMNIQRNPLCGRNFEYFSEDPLLSGLSAAAVSRGIQSEGVGACIKHFAANNQEINRMYNDSRVSERALRELYLRNFEIAVREADPWVLMTSYNYLNGVQTSEDRHLLKDILRGEFGFDGMVVSDWGSGYDPVAQIAAGNDNIQSGSLKAYNAILEAARSGELSEEDLDYCVRNVLELIVKCIRYKGYEFSNKPDLARGLAISAEAGAESMVLLKNDDATLPVLRSQKLALFGTTSYDLISGGTGAGDVNTTGTVGLVESLEQEGFCCDSTVAEAYAGFMKAEYERLASINAKRSWWLGKIRALEMPYEAVKALAQASLPGNDVAIVTIGRRSGEGTDRHIDDDFNLTAEELGTIRAVCEVYHAAGKPVAVVLNIAGVVETASWKDLPDAILNAWLPGQGAGIALAQVLSGKVNPSGHLPVTFPVAYADVPSQNFPALNLFFDRNHSWFHYETETPNIDYTEYEEGIYVGYRYFQTKDVPVSYPFGYGMSYTEFVQGEPVVKAVKGGWDVELSVKNNGGFGGRHLVQLYVSAPEGALDKPARELKAYAKTPLLAPGQSCTVKLHVKRSDLASYDEASASWLVDAGDYRFQFGSNARDIISETVVTVR